MSSAPKVQLHFKDRLVAEVAFTGDALRIGRMKENDVVVNNLAVSRFHAVLRRTPDGFEIEDLKSENGTFVNGVRAEGPLPVALGDRVQIGKHSLVIGEGTARPVAAPARGASDAWDAAQTYYGPLHAEVSTQATAAPAAPDDAEELLLSEALEDAETGTGVELAAAAEPAAPGDLFAPEEGGLDTPDPEGAFAFGEEDLFPEAEPMAPADLGAEDAADVVAGDLHEGDGDLLEPLTDPMPAAAGGEQTSLFEFGRDSDLGQSDPSQRRAGAAAAVAPAPMAPVQHAGLLVQRSGRLVSVHAWEGPEVLVGRATECHLPLPHPGVSRKHALFVRDGDAFEVRDLDSVNGVAVNGARVQRHRLQVGDVVRIEDFELTFVLDSQPVGEGVVAPKRVAGADEVDPGHHTQLAGAPLAEEAVLAHEDLLMANDETDADEEKEEAATVTAVRLSQRSAAPPLPALAERLQIELELAIAELPVALRTALETLAEDGDAVVPVKLRVRVR